MNETAISKSLPSSPRELSRLLDMCGSLKQKLVAFVQANYTQEIRTNPAIGTKTTFSQGDITRATESVLYEYRHKNGDTVIDRFVQQSSQLSPQQKEIVDGWKTSFWGVFKLHDSSGQGVDAVNLVDDLKYRLVSNTNTLEVRRMLRGKGFVMSRIVPLFDAWMFSGTQQTMSASENRMAYGFAAQLAQSYPHLFFRNPINLERSIEREKQNYLHFVERFGAPWIVGKAGEIEKQSKEFMFPDDSEMIPADVDEMVALPKVLHRAKTVGMICDPKEGMYFLEEFGEFLDALHNPANAKRRKTRNLLLGYLEGTGVSPAVFSFVAEERPEASNRMMAELLSHPGFTWEKDGEACLRRYNPEFVEHPRYPGTILLNDKLMDGLKYLQNESSEQRCSSFTADEEESMDDEFLPFDEATPDSTVKINWKKIKSKRKSAKAARKRNRRKK
jgi:hypothetical protein